MSTYKKIMLLSLVMFLSTTTLTEAQNIPSCAEKLIPCVNYINSSTTTPPSSCCDPLSEAVANERTCLCNLYDTPGLLQNFGINVTLALNLTQRCGISGDLSACTTAQSPTAVPPPSEEANKKQQYHFVLVHGSCHGAWTWYKVTPQLRSEGHRVVTVELAASGINMKRIEEVQTFEEYSKPLLEVLASVAEDEKVILVGHSFGGLSVALAAERFPEKVSVVIFLTAFMPDTVHHPSFVLEQFFQRVPADHMMDTQFSTYGTPQQNLSTVLFGPNYLSLKLYQLSPIEDLELAKALLRPSSIFQDDLSKIRKFSKKGFGAVKRVYVICGEDQGIPQELQRWMIENSPVLDVVEIKDADHMPMFSRPQQLCHSLLNIAHNYHV